jgi:hypothetical protein
LFFYHKCNPSPPLGNYKRGGRGHIWGTLIKTDPYSRTHLTDQELKLMRHQRDLRSALSLKSL